MRYTWTDGRIIHKGGPFEVNGVSYPANWLDLATAEDIADIGLTALEDPQPTLDEAKRVAKSAIDLEAEQARQRYITPGSGKAMSYQQVAAEAVRFVATGGAGSYPFLQARVDSGRYANLNAAAQGTIAIESQWAIIGSAIDRVEDAAKLAIDAASTVADVRAATEVTWP